MGDCQFSFVMGNLDVDVRLSSPMIGASGLEFHQDFGGFRVQWTLRTQRVSRSQRGAGKSVYFGLAWRPRDRILGSDTFIESLRSHKSVFVITNAHLHVHVQVSAGEGEDKDEGGGATAEGQTATPFTVNSSPLTAHELTSSRAHE